MASTPKDLDGFLSLLLTSDTKMRLSIGSKLYTYLNDPSNSIECSDIGQVIDCMVTWLRSSNFRIVFLALDIMIEFIDRMKYDFQTYLPGILSHIIDRLGDSKDQIRDKTLFLLMKLMECNAISPQNLFDRIAACAFNHKNSNVREHACNFLISTLEEHGAASLSVSKLVPYIVKLLSDPKASVRSTSFNVLVGIYIRVGDKLRIDLQKKYQIPQNKLSALMKSFDDVKESGDMLCSIISQNNQIEDDIDNCVKKIRTLSATRRPIITPLRTNIVSSFSKIPKSPLLNKSAPGAVDENSFLTAFHEIAQIQIYTGKDVEEVLRKSKEIIENANQDWSKRVEYLKKIRSLILNGALDYEEFYVNLNNLLNAFQVAVKDLRSQVVRECCITLAFLSKTLGWKFDHFSETLMINLINLIQNSAKVIASSGLVAIKFILQYTHAPRLIPTICRNLSSKSKEIRRACCEFINLILQTWEFNIIERYVSNIQEAIKKGVMDADGDARMYSRKAFSEFQNHFPEHADIILATVDNNYRKQLCCNSNSGSTSSLPKAITTSPRRCIQVRSNSAIDANAAKRANARAQYTAFRRQKVGGWNSSLPRSEKKDQLTERSGHQKTRTINQISSSCVADVEVKNNFLGDLGGGVGEMKEDYIKKLIEDLNTNDSTLEGRKILLSNLKEFLSQASSEMVIINFQRLLRIILSLISDERSTIREAALGLLQTMVKKKPVAFCFKDFIELVILKVLTATRDECKEVMKAADSCAISISLDLPAESVIKVIVPLITSEDYPVNLVAIKMLTKLVDHSPCTVNGHVTKIMSGLLAAYDNMDSVVRKSAVFAIVALHKELGEHVVQPYYSNLSGAKIKLLQLYILRSQQGSSGSTSQRCI